MVTITTGIKCIKCGDLAMHDLDCNTTEEMVICHRCGYQYHYELEYDDKYKPKKDAEGKLILKTYEINDALGSACFTGKGEHAVGSCGPYINEEDLKKYIAEHKDELVMANYTKKIDGEWFIVDELTNEVKSY